MSSSTAAYGGRHGGAGGKFTKKSLNKSHPKPYDRPSPPNNRWLSKIIEAPFAGANKLLSFVFRQQNTDADKEIEDVLPETVTNVVDSATKLPLDCGGMDYDGCGVAELEDVLKQKKFTRSEIDQLSALLLSRTNENLDGAGKGMSGPKLSDLQAVATSRDQFSTLSAHENNIEHALSGAISTPDVKSKVLPGDAASPAEIAKAYMAGRRTEESPSVLRLQSRSLDEEVSTPCNSLSRSISPSLFLNQKAASNIGTSSNGFMTPRFRGRSIIHNTARTPYSRLHPVMSHKAAETNFRIGGGSSYHNVTENSHYNKQAIKRRRSVLENDIGSVGPIRRIRQKSNLLHPKTLSLPPSRGRQETHVTGMLSDVSELSYSVEHGYQNRSSSNVMAIHNLPGKSSRFVPSQSIEMAQKIFEQLDKFSPKPMKKPSPESLESLKCSPSSQDMKIPKRSLDNYVCEHNDVTTETSPITDQLCLKLDDNVPSKEVALSTSLIEGRQHAESSSKSVTMPDTLLSDQTVAERPPEMKPTAQLGKIELEYVANGCSPSETIVSSPSVLPASPANMSLFDVISAPHSTLQSDEVAQQTGKRNFAIAYGPNSDNLPPAVSTTLSAAKETKSELLLSGNEVAAQVNVPEKTVNTNPPVFKSGDPPSLETLPNGQTLSASNTTDNACDKSNATSNVSDARPSAVTSGGNAIFSFTAQTLESTGDVQSAGLGTANKHTSFGADSTPVSVFAPTLGGSPNPFSSRPMTASNALSNPFTVPLASTSSSANQTTTVFHAPSSPAVTFGLGPSGGTTSTFIFEATSNSSASNSSPSGFGGSSGLAASTSAMPNSPFQSPSPFGIASSQSFTIGSSSFSNNDQMTMEDTMAEDSPEQVAPPGGYSPSPSAPLGGFGFTAPQSPVVPQNSLFQPSGSFEFKSGTSSSIFSVGTSTDKSQRRIFKPKRGLRKK